MKKIIISSMTMIILFTSLAGCTNTSQVEDKSNIEYYSTSVSTQLDEVQDETILIDEAQAEVIFIDEKLDENLFISAELRMPVKSLYEYSTKLKNFDYDKVQEALWQNAEESKVSIDENAYIGGDNGCGFLLYQRNDEANHLDTYCFYADDNGLGDDRDLSFMSKEDAVMEIQSLIEQFEVGGELGTPDVIAMDKIDFENVQKAIMDDDEYKGILPAKNYGNDEFDENLEVYRMTFPVEVNGIPAYGRNEPLLQQTRDMIIAQQTGVTVLLSNNGIEMISMMGGLEPYSNQKKEVDIIGKDGIKDAIATKFGDVILTDEYKAVNIWMEYFPLLVDGSFTDVDLIPVWCIDFEINGEMDEDFVYTLRINAITGDEVS